MSQENIVAQNNEVIDITGKIIMGKYCAVSKDWNENQKYPNHKLIDHSDFEKFDLSNGFIEFNGLDISIDGKKYAQKYIRLYFDIDCESESKDEAMEYYNDAIKFMNEIKFTFGEFAVCGYSNNNEIASEINCKYNKHADKILSLHIVFFETCLLITDLLKLIDANKYIIPEWVDKSVYKIEQRRAFRHGKSPKFINFNDHKAPDQTKFISAIGSITNGKNDKDLLITPTKENIEKCILDTDNLLFWFDKRKDFIQSNITKNSTNETKVISVAALNHEDFTTIIKEINEYESENEDLSFVIDDEKCLELILKCFEPVYENLEKISCIIGASPFSKEILLKYIPVWYRSGVHGRPEASECFIKQYYKSERSNKWFYSIIKHLPETVKEAFLSKFGFNTIDGSITFDIHTTFTINDIRDNIEKGKYYSYKTFESDDAKLVKKAKKLPKKFECEMCYIKDKIFDKIIIKKFPVIN